MMTTTLYTDRERVYSQCGQMVRYGNTASHSLCLKLTVSGIIPFDGVPNKEVVTIHAAVTVIFILLAVAGITFAAVCLTFNFVYRESKLVGYVRSNMHWSQSAPN